MFNTVYMLLHVVGVAPFLPSSLLPTQRLRDADDIILMKVYDCD